MVRTHTDNYTRTHALTQTGILNSLQLCHIRAISPQRLFTSHIKVTFADKTCLLRLPSKSRENETSQSRSAAAEKLPALPLQKPRQPHKTPCAVMIDEARFTLDVTCTAAAVVPTLCTRWLQYR